MPGRPVPGDGVQRARLRGRPRRALAVERRRDPVPRGHRRRRDRLPRHAVVVGQGGRGPRPRGARAGRHLRRRPRVEPVRAQRPHAGRPAPAVQARVAGRPARHGGGLAGRRPGGADRPGRRLEHRAARTTTSGTWRSSPTRTHVSPPERAAFRAVVDAGYADVVRPYAPGPGVYTYWDYTQLRFPRREGMRIDFVLGSPALAGPRRPARRSTARSARARAPATTPR